MAEKFPWIQFYYKEYYIDTAQCSPSTRGIWMDFIIAMHNDNRSGVITGTRESLARVGRCSAVDCDLAIFELQSHNVADITERNGIVTVQNRRMVRDKKEREQSKNRVSKHREGYSGNGVTRMSRSGNADVTGQKSEVRSQKSENRERVSTTPHVDARLSVAYATGNIPKSADEVIAYYMGGQMGTAIPQNLAVPAGQSYYSKRERVGWVIGDSRAPIMNWKADAKIMWGYWQQDYMERKRKDEQRYTPPVSTPAPVQQTRARKPVQISDVLSMAVPNQPMTRERRIQNRIEQGMAREAAEREVDIMLAKEKSDSRL